MADDAVNISFGASIEDFKAKMGQVVELLKGVGDGVKEELGSRAASGFGVFGKDAENIAQRVASSLATLPPALKTVGVAVLGLGAIIGAGIFAKAMADNNAEMVESTRDLARALGITTNEASVMRAVFDDVGVSQGEYEGAAKGLSRQLRTNEEGMNRFGLVTRDASGNLLPLNTVMLEAIRLMGTYREGQDRAEAGHAFFGRGVSASSRMLLINAEVIKAVREEVERLGLEVGEKATSGYEEFDAAADQATRVQQGFAKAIQEAVLPVALELTEWFNNSGPDAISVMRGALASLGTAFVLVTNGVRVLWEFIFAFVKSVAEPIRAVTEAVGRAMVGDFAGAGAQLKNISGVVSGAWDSAFAKMTDSSQKTL